METVPLESAAEAYEELARRAEGGETIVVTRDGRPIFDIVPRVPRSRRGFDAEAAEAYLRANGIVRTTGFIPDDFDDPLPEHFLLRPLPRPSTWPTPSQAKPATAGRLVGPLLGCRDDDDSDRGT